MSKPRVFVTRIIPEGGLKLVREACEAEIWEDELPPPREVLLEKVRGVEGLLSLLTDTVDAELLDAAGPQLKVVANYAVGYNNIDVAAATARGIAVGNTPGVLTDSCDGTSTTPRWGSSALAAWGRA
jgi:glyoxylate reductase